MTYKHCSLLNQPIIKNSHWDSTCDFPASCLSSVNQRWLGSLVMKLVSIFRQETYIFQEGAVWKIWFHFKAWNFMSDFLTRGSKRQSLLSAAMHCGCWMVTNSTKSSPSTPDYKTQRQAGITACDCSLILMSLTVTEDKNGESLLVYFHQISVS